MKNKFIKSLMVGVMIGVLATPAFALNLSTTVAAATTAGVITNLINIPCRINTISIVNNNASVASTFQIWDAPNTNSTMGGIVGLLQYTNSGYIGITSYTTNLQVFYTNAMGLTNFQVIGNYTNNPVYRSNVLWTATNTVAGALYSYRLLFQGQVAAATTLTITNQFTVAYGIVITNTVGTNTYNIDYSSGL